MTDDELKSLLEPMVIDFWEDAEYVAKSFTGERKDSAGRRICYSNGKRVPCSTLDKKPSKKDGKPKKSDVSSDASGRANEILSASNGKKLTAAQVRELSKHVNNMTLAQLGEFQKKFNLSAKGRLKQDRIDSLLESVKSRKPESKPKKSGKKPAESKPESATKPETTATATESDTSNNQGGKKAIDYKQNNPDHPVAKQIREDTENAAIVQKFLDSVSEQVDALNNAKTISDIEARLPSMFIAYSKLKKGKKRDEMKKQYDTMREMVKSHYSATRDYVKQVEEARIELVKQIGGVAKINAPSVMSKLSGDKSLSDEQKKGLSQTHDFINGVSNFESPPDVKICTDYDSKRSCYISHTKTVNIGNMTGSEMTDENKSSYVHEMGHYIEFTKPGVKDKAREFLAYRVGNEEFSSIGQATGITSMVDEMGRKDDFDRAFNPIFAYYIGKQYWDATEIVSMGIQKMWSDPVGFATKDPEYFQFMVSVLRS